MERKVIKSECRKMILKVKEFCELESKNKELLIPLKNVQMRIAAMTGVFVKKVSRITKEGKNRPQTKKVDLDNFELSAIRQKIHFTWLRKSYIR
ncbi:unnamed protein product [Euphydryas editha]|uniref:Uncharacterized protein n=1 Tax=Euphydryas editha TaxID=104508 RepID=A0AAU9URL0_EUPED|nr:unnamed protein product [Euphydryas editha]